MTTTIAPPRLITADEFLLMERTPGKRYELVRGVLKEKDMGTGLPHSINLSFAHFALFPYTAGADNGLLCIGEPCYRVARNPDTVLCPDMAWIAPGRVPPGTVGYPELTPDLCIEVASPSNARADRLLSNKAQMWLDFGAREVWVLNPEDIAVTRYRPNMPPAILSDDDILDGGELLPGFSVAVWQLFRRQR